MWFIYLVLALAIIQTWATIASCSTDDSGLLDSDDRRFDIDEFDDYSERRLPKGKVLVTMAELEDLPLDVQLDAKYPLYEGKVVVAMVDLKKLPRKLRRAYKSRLYDDDI